MASANKKVQGCYNYRVDATAAACECMFEHTLGMLRVLTCRTRYLYTIKWFFQQSVLLAVQAQTGQFFPCFFMRFYNH